MRAYVCVCLCKYVSECVSTHARMHACTHAYMHTCTHPLPVCVLVRQPSRHFPLNLAKIPPNQVIADFGRGSSVQSESE